jgi:acetyltransferase-like isoleucine patch superfamily enzyme
MARLMVNPRVLKLLRDRRVYHSYSGSDRWDSQTVLVVAEDCEIEPYAQIFQGHVIPRALGAFSYSNSPFDPAMRVGRYSSIAWQVSVMGERHPTEWAATSPIFYQPVPGGAPNAGLRAYRDSTQMNVREYDQGETAVTIGHDVWIGEQVLLKRGITIGSGAVIGARALVLEDVPPYAVVVGQPARVIKYRFSPELIARFLELEWWRFSAAEISKLPLERSDRFLDVLSEKIATETMNPMRPATLRFRDLVDAAQQKVAVQLPSP